MNRTLACGFSAVLAAIVAVPAQAGVGRMDSKPLWDLADHGGPTPIDAAHFVEIPNSCLPDSYAFTVEATYRFDDMSDEAVMSLLDCTVGETGFGARCDTIRTSGKVMQLRVNGETYGGSGVWFLGGHKDGKAWWKPNGTELKLTISARKGWISVYQDDVLQKAYMMQVTPNLAPIRAGGDVYARDKSRYPDMKGVTLLSLRIWDGLEEYRGIGEPEKKETGFAAGKGWQVRVPVEPLKDKPNVFYYGDSISVGYTAPLAELTKGKANLYHWMSCLYEPGAEGVDVRKFREIGKLADYDYVVFNNGGHSAHWTTDKVTDDQVRASYRALVAAMRELAPHAKRLVYVMTTPRTRINGESEEKIAKLLEENVTIERLNRIAREVMDEERVTVLDFYSRFQARTDYWRGDGYHFRPPAYAEIAQAICAEVLSKAKFLWVELLGFDNTKPDYGVEEFLSRMGKKPSAISILLTEHAFFHDHRGLDRDLVLPEGVTSYDSRPWNEERNRQDWTAYQLRGLVKEIRSRGIDVFPSFFEWGIFDICAKRPDGEPYVDFFIRQMLSFLKDYGFTGLHGSDGFGHPRLGLGQREPKVTDWRKAADDWTAFWRKASAALKREGYKVYLNTVWTRDPYEALVRYGMDYDALCGTDIDGFICESSASVLELEGWNLSEETTLDKSVAMLTRMGTCVRGRKELLLLHCIKDGNEQYNALRHAPTRAVAEAMAMAAVTVDGRRALEGEMACLADGIRPDEWNQLDGLWDAAFAGTPATSEGCRVVWSDRAFRTECETLPKLELASSCTLLAKLIHAGAVIGGGVTLEAALKDEAAPLLVLNPGCFPAEELAALKRRSAAVVEFGYGFDGFPEDPTVERGRYWPQPMYERLPSKAAFGRAVSAVNAASAVRPADEGQEGLVLSSFLGTDGNRYIMARNNRERYLNASFSVDEGLLGAKSLTLDPAAPISVFSQPVGAALGAKIPPSGAIVVRCVPSGGTSALPDENTIREWFARFRATDRERNQNTIWNYRAFEWMKDEIPLFDCPDSEIVRTYYFRWWTYRKHLRKTDRGWVVTEFLPNVGWAGPENTISCPFGHHLREGRWLRSPEFLDDYISFMLAHGRISGKGAYVCWPAWGALERAKVTGNFAVLERWLPRFADNWRTWERTNFDPKLGLFKVVDNYEGTEHSLSSHGARPMINAAMWAEATAIARISARAGQSALADEFAAKAKALEDAIGARLWNADRGFFTTFGDRGHSDVRELHGYAPFYFGMPFAGHGDVWRHLTDERGFKAPFGLTFPERCAPGFVVKPDYRAHECEWNGPSWPYATSVALTALYGTLQSGEGGLPVGADDFAALLHQYAAQQKRVREKDGKTVPWIDENLDAFTGTWLARDILNFRRAHPELKLPIHAEERGKDYNHSTFCDLVIAGLCGVVPLAEGCFEVKPLVPASWDWWCLDRLYYHGRDYRIVFDRDGTHYNLGKGLQVVELPMNTKGRESK